MTAKKVALLRGINVGTAKAISMADLAAVFESLGLTGVKTVLRSGNVVFEGDVRGAELADAVESATGVRAGVLVLGASEFRRIAAADPFIGVATDGSKSFVTFLGERQTGLEAPDAAALAPERIALAPDAIYQWMPDGLLQSRVPKSFWRGVSGTVTARNRNTVERLLALLGD
jgi:uncharacterized protein (DUF1697 family)